MTAKTAILAALANAKARTLPDQVSVGTSVAAVTAMVRQSRDANERCYSSPLVNQQIMWA